MSFQVPCPPPHLYGLCRIWFAAQMTALTASGALDGAYASPFLSTARLPLTVGCRLLLEVDAVFGGTPPVGP